MKVELEVVDNERRRSVEHAIHLTVCRNDGGGIVLLFPCKRAGLQSPQSVAAAVYGHHATATPTTTLWLSSVCTASPGALRNWYQHVIHQSSSFSVQEVLGGEAVVGWWYHNDNTGESAKWQLLMM